MRHVIAQTESRGSCVYHNASPPPSVNVRDLAVASDNMTRINMNQHVSLESGKMHQHFFP